MTSQTSNEALDKTRQYIDTTLSVAKYTCQDETILQPRHTLNPSPHPFPNTLNPEDSLLNPLDQPADGPFNPLPPQSNLRLVQACSD